MRQSEAKPVASGPDAPEALGVGGPRSEATRRGILEAARTIFATHGYEQTTIRAVAAQVGHRRVADQLPRYLLTELRTRYRDDATLTVKLPASALSALKPGHRDSVAITLVGTNPNGTGRTRAALAALKIQT